jgi:anti-sigma regulatory factor (Ser/Thr protein kinase)
MSLLDFFKLLISKDSRESIASALAALKRSPEWKDRLLIIKEKFTGIQYAEALELIAFIIAIAGEKGWSDSECSRGELVLRELIDNAFIHGAKNQVKSWVKIQLTLSPETLSILVSDSSNGFNLASALLKADNASGIGLVKELSSRFTQPQPNTVHVLLDRRQKGKIIFNECEGYIHVDLSGTMGGYQLPAFPAEISYDKIDDIENIVKSYPSSTIFIVDFSEARMILSSWMRVVGRIKKIIESHGASVGFLASKEVNEVWKYLEFTSKLNIGSNLDDILKRTIISE